MSNSEDQCNNCDSQMPEEESHLPICYDCRVKEIRSKRSDVEL